MFQSSDFRTSVLRGADSRASWSDIVSIHQGSNWRWGRTSWVCGRRPPHCPGRSGWWFPSSTWYQPLFCFPSPFWDYESSSLTHTYFCTGSTANQRCRKGLLNWTQAHVLHPSRNSDMDNEPLSRPRSCSAEAAQEMWILDDTGGYEVNHIISGWPSDIVGRVVEVESSKDRLGIVGTCLESRWF